MPVTSSGVPVSLNTSLEVALATLLRSDLSGVMATRMIVARLKMTKVVQAYSPKTMWHRRNSPVIR
jgi:hypothetical protein